MKDCNKIACNSMNFCGTVQPGATCQVDTDCGGGPCNSEKTCGKLANGSACGSGADCVSSFCAHASASAQGVCGTGEAKQPCSGAADCKTGLGCNSAHACGLLDAGAKCASGKECPDGICNSLGSCGALAVGKVCGVGGDCTSGFCQHKPGQSGGVCGSGADGNDCTSGDDCVGKFCASSGVCGTLAKGAKCATAKDCADGICNSLGKCGPLPNGALCSDDVSCESAKCAKANGTCADFSKSVCTAGGIGDVCDADAQCGSGHCVPDAAVGCLFKGACTTGLIGAACWNGPDCASGKCEGGKCVPGTACENQPDGTSCDDANACTKSDQCSGGVCVGGTAMVCIASDQCHDAGTCDTGTGQCSNPAKANGAACTDGNACSQTDSCQVGVCTGDNPVVCTASDQCHDAGTCDAATGQCSTPAKANGAACDDGNGCTQLDACQVGLCTGGNSVVCVAVDQCHDVGTCVPASGACTSPNKVDGTACTDGDVCTVGDGCQGGVCLSGTPTSCDDGNLCLDDFCDKTTGCYHLANMVTCTDGDACTVNDICTGGVCGGSSCSSINASCSGGGCMCNPGFAGTSPTCVCGGSLVEVVTAAGAESVCVYDYPVWGERDDSPNSYKDNGDGTVSDSQTKLMWQQLTSGTHAWSDAKTYCENLALAGHDDWRLPSVAEGESLVDYKLDSPQISDTAFTGASSTQYWTSIIDTEKSSESWNIDLTSGNGVYASSATLARATRCVRTNGALGAPITRFTTGAGGAGTVLDNATGLLWQQAAPAAGFTWSASSAAGSAQAYCASLSLGTVGGGWRLPTQRELFGLVDRRLSNPALDANAFPNTPSTYFWSATQWFSGNDAWRVFFGDGTSDLGPLLQPPRVRCVQ